MEVAEAGTLASAVSPKGCDKCNSYSSGLFVTCDDLGMRVRGLEVFFEITSAGSFGLNACS